MSRHAAVFALLVACDGASPSAPRDAAPETSADVAIDAPPVVDPTPPAEPGRHAVTVADTRQVIPGPGLPAASPPENSNNNLDVVRHEGRVWLV